MAQNIFVNSRCTWIDCYLDELIIVLFTFCIFLVSFLFVCLPIAFSVGAPIHMLKS